MSRDEWIDQLYDAAVAFVRRTKKCKAVDLQRELRIGYPTAARLLDMMEDEGVVSERGNDGQREVVE
jgi:S-DNA-T family DNA segregation ATPase FtsK/SpoIIIE